MSEKRIIMPDEATLENMEKLLASKHGTLPVSALTLRYLEALSIEPDSVYARHEIPKGNGKKRLIEAPEKDLKTFQRAILRVLNNNRMPEGVYGFSRGRSAYKGLRKMADNVGARADGKGDLRGVFSTDISDFFPSVKEDQVKEEVYRYLLRILHRTPNGPHLSPEMVNNLADIITDLCCVHGRLPQGAPTSPVLANMVGTRFDHQIKQVIGPDQEYGRYADDIIIMGIEKLPRDKQNLIRSILESFGFKTSIPKTTNEHGKQNYNIWGVEVFPKSSRGKDEITFKLPASQENEWAKDIFEFINSGDLPKTTQDLLDHPRYRKIMGRLSHAYVVTYYGETDHKNPLLLPKKLAHAWSHLCKKFKNILPQNFHEYFIKDGFHYEKDVEYRKVTPEIFEERLKKFLEKNGIDETSFMKKLEEEKKRILKFESKARDEDVDMMIANGYFDEIIDCWDEMSASEKQEKCVELYVSLAAFVQLKLAIEEKKPEETETSPKKKKKTATGVVKKTGLKLAEVETDKENESLLSEELNELWQQLREKLGADANGHKYLFWEKEKVTSYVLTPDKKPASGPRPDGYLTLPGFQN